MDKKIEERRDLLERLDKINKKTGFIGNRGTMYMPDMLLKEFVENLEKE